MMLGEHFVRCEGILRRLKRGTCEVPDLYNLLGWPVRRDLRYGNMPDGLLTNGNARPVWNAPFISMGTETPMDLRFKTEEFKTFQVHDFEAFLRWAIREYALPRYLADVYRVLWARVALEEL